MDDRLKGPKIEERKKEEGKKEAAVQAIEQRVRDSSKEVKKTR
jgi:hypothetical protein